MSAVYDGYHHRHHHNCYCHHCYYSRYRCRHCYCWCSCHGNYRPFSNLLLLKNGDHTFRKKGSGKLLQESRKLNCPVQVHVREIIKFPEYKVRRLTQLESINNRDYNRNESIIRDFLCCFLDRWKDRVALQKQIKKSAESHRRRHSKKWKMDPRQFTVRWRTYHAP